MAPEQPARSGIDFSAFRDPKLARELIERIHELVGDRTINLMEVCGTHTVSIGRYGFRSIMPAGLKLLSGPGCPVCVTANRDIDHAIALANIDGAIITTFGDMMRVPTTAGSLFSAKAEGADVRIVYSIDDAVKMARDQPDKPLVFVGVGDLVAGGDAHGTSGALGDGDSHIVQHLLEAEADDGVLVLSLIHI